MVPHSERSIALLLFASLALAMAYGTARSQTLHLAVQEGPNEAGAKRFIDLASVIPTASDVCDAVGALFNKGQIRDVLLHALPESYWRHSVNLSEARHLMSDHAWREAVSGDYSMVHYENQSFDVGRINLVRGKPAAWVFSTSVGSLHNPLAWLFASTANGSTPDRLLLQIGFEASGYFDIAFIRFRGVPFMVEIFDGDRGPSADVRAMSPSNATCSFSPPK